MKKRNSSRKTRPRLALTILFSAVIFIFFLLISLVTGGVILYLFRSHRVPPGGPWQHPQVRILILVAVSIALGVLLSFLLSQIYLIPVNRVIDAMDSLAHGNFKTRLTFHTGFRRHPAAVEVTDSFNHMAEELEKTQMLRSDFIDNFSHEFKTPIVSIAGFADLLLEADLPGEERKEYIRIISEESHRLSDMVTNVLDLTRIENQTILTDVTRFNLSEQIRSCVLLLENKWTEKALDLEVDFGEYLYEGNRGMLKQVWLNLIDNAIKFSDPGGLLRIGITETPENLLISISDTGLQISKENMERIFNKFYQADESHATEGYGIGLSVVKGIVELHGGLVIPSSGGGTTVFTVVLPKKREASLKFAP